MRPGGVVTGSRVSGGGDGGADGHLCTPFKACRSLLPFLMRKHLLGHSASILMPGNLLEGWVTQGHRGISTQFPQG